MAIYQKINKTSMSFSIVQQAALSPEHLFYKQKVDKTCMP
jgi:hypothetical protein